MYSPVMISVAPPSSGRGTRCHIDPGSLWHPTGVATRGMSRCDRSRIRAYRPCTQSRMRSLSRGRSHRPRRPVGRVLRRLLERLDDDPLDVGIGDPPGDAGPRIVAQTVQAPLEEAPPPGCGPCPARHLHDRVVFGALQHDPRPLRQSLSRRSATQPALQHRPLGISDRQRRNPRTRTTHTRLTTNLRLRSVVRVYPMPMTQCRPAVARKVGMGSVAEGISR